MKTVRNAVLILTLLIVLTSSAWVKLTLIRPSEIVLPDNLKSVAIIDRTLSADNTESKVEQVLTGEAFHQDEQAGIKIADGFIEACSGTRRFETIRTSERFTSNGTKNTFPTPLDWDTVNEICKRHQSDVLLSVEIFDTDFILTNAPVKIDAKEEDGKIVPRVEFKAMGVAIINLGIRLYDAVNHVIVDEFQTSHRLNFDVQASTLQAALNQLLDKTEAINRASFDAGFIYGQRITPTYYQVTRYFFDKPKKELGAGVRYSEVANWKSAIEAWMKVVEKGDKKDAGRAAYNIAVAHEVLGDLEKAKEWAARSYTEFEEKDANDYYRALNDRIEEEIRVKEQMKESAYR